MQWIDVEMSNELDGINKNHKLINLDDNKFNSQQYKLWLIHLISSFTSCVNSEGMCIEDGCQAQSDENNCNNSKKCKWLSKCDIKTCETAGRNIIFTSHQDCENYLSNCTLSDSGIGCMLIKYSCNQYTREIQCYRSILSKCTWHNNQCFESKCEYYTYSTHEDCNKELQDCTSDGSQCISLKLNCSLYTQMESCSYNIQIETARLIFFDQQFRIAYAYLDFIGSIEQKMKAQINIYIQQISSELISNIIFTKRFELHQNILSEQKQMDEPYRREVSALVSFLVSKCILKSIQEIQQRFNEFQLRIKYSEKYIKQNKLKHLSEDEYQINFKFSDLMQEELNYVQVIFIMIIYDLNFLQQIIKQYQMSEASSPVREGSYKLRTHSNCNFMFSRSLIQPHSERIQIQGDNAMLLKFEYLNQSIPLLGLLSKAHCKLTDGMTIYNQVKKYSFFQELFNSSRLRNDMEQIYHLCTKLQLEVFKQGSIILREGAIQNDKMYLIIEGRVLIFKQQYSLTRQQLKGQQTVTKTELQSDILKNYMKNYGSLINDLNPGNYFGEKALMENNRDAQRSATCIADVDTYLISLNRNEFFEVLGQFKKDADFKREVFQSVIPYFERITSTLMIESLMYSFNEEIKLRDETVTQEGEQANTLYILYEGEVAIMKKHENHQMLLCSLHNQQVIGEESLFEENYYYTVVVHSQQAKFYKISSQSFVLKGSQQCVKGLKSMMEKKLQTRTLLFQTIIKKSIEHRETTKTLIRNRNQSSQEENQKKQYYGITNRQQRKLDTTINRGSSIFSSNQTNQSLNTQNSLKQVTKCLEDYALFQVKFEENKQKRNCFKQSIQYQQLQQKLGINQKTESSSPSKQETEQQKDFSSRTDSIYTMKNKNSLSSRTKSSLIQNFLQFNTIDAMKKKLTNQKKNYLIKSMKQMKDLQLIKIRCQTLEQ